MVKYCFYLKYLHCLPIQENTTGYSGYPGCVLCTVVNVLSAEHYIVFFFDAIHCALLSFNMFDSFISAANGT